jgi:hypothetical protein
LCFFLYKYHFIKWYETKYLLIGGSHEWNMIISTPQDENRSCMYRKTQHFLFILTIHVSLWWHYNLKFPSFSYIECWNTTVVFSETGKSVSLYLLNDIVTWIDSRLNVYLSMLTWWANGNLVNVCGWQIRISYIDTILSYESSMYLGNDDLPFKWYPTCCNDCPGVLHSVT